jgi:LTXXQ motif family protein
VPVVYLKYFVESKLKDASAKAADTLKGSCPTSIPQSPIERLDAMGQRLDSMMQAVKTVRPALNDFYTSLDDEQKPASTS